MGNKFKNMNDYRKIYVMVMCLYIVAQIVGGALFEVYVSSWTDKKIGAWYCGIVAVASLLAIYLYDKGISKVPTVIDRMLEIGLFVTGAIGVFGAVALYKCEEFFVAAMLAGAVISIIVLTMTFYLDESDQ